MVFFAFSVLFQKLELGRKGLQKTLQDGMEFDSEINSASFFHHLVSSKKQEEACRFISDRAVVIEFEFPFRIDFPLRIKICSRDGHYFRLDFPGFSIP